MKNFLLTTITIIGIVLGANAQTKGTLEYLDKLNGINPIMLNDSLTKHLKILDPIGKIERKNTLCSLDEDYCVLNYANLKQVRVKFVDYTARNIVFFVEPKFIDICLEELIKLYGEPHKDGENYIWKAKKTILIYDKKPKDFSEVALGIFYRLEDF